MTPKLPIYPRILAIAPSSKGFGFAVLEGVDTLADWGGKSVECADKNAQSQAKVKELITHYQPEVLVLQDTSTKTSKRFPRIKKLSGELIALAKTQKLPVLQYSQEQIQQTYFPEGQGTKHELAQIIAGRFPEELGSRLPLKRRPWESEKAVMDIFEATALARMPLLWKKVRL
jgi:Holliday junction resolvasome RuvABC endonuclease subunit